MDEHETTILSRWQQGDMLLYNHFLNKFNALIDVYGRKRMEQVSL